MASTAEDWTGAVPAGKANQRVGEEEAAAVPDAGPGVQRPSDRRRQLRARRHGPGAPAAASNGHGKGALENSLA
jgi:hypothetical protein